MKKLYFILIGFLVFSGVEAQIINIPDVNFKAKLLSATSDNSIASSQTPYYNNGFCFVSSYNKIDINNDGEIQLSEALLIKYLDITFAGISNIEGIEYFSNLNYLNCNSNQITNLNSNVLTNLIYLNCQSNRLSNLNVSSLINLVYLNYSYNLLSNVVLNGLINLQQLNCSSNQISSLNVISLTNLVYLNCSYNQLSNIVLNGLINLQELDCSINLFTTLDVSVLTNLQALYCQSNQISSLNLSGLTNLQTLYCASNQISSLNLNGLSNLHFLVCSYNLISSINTTGLYNLTFFNCDNNQIQNLNVAGSIHLSELYFSNNQITSINLSTLSNLNKLFCNYNQLSTLNVSGLTNLGDLHCYGNQLTSIDVSGLSNLNYLDCSDNQLISLFIKNGSFENNLVFDSNPNLQYICADDNQISQVQNLINQYGYTNCHMNSYCSFVPGGTFYRIQGNNRYDEDNNGCSSTDINYPNLELNIADGIYTANIIPDTSSTYHYDVQAGTQTITPTLENPTYFNISPTTATVTFPSASSPYTQDFCITANGTHNDLEVILLPIGNARPGFDAHYQIVYKNKGTNTQSGTVNLMFNDAVLDYVSATPIVDLQTVNNLIWNFSNLAPFETRVIDVVLNLNSPLEVPPLNSGDILNYTATVNGLTDETATDNTSTINQIVVNAFDPNYKTCTEGETINPNSVGKYVHYMIGFENDGTANAQNIVVKDMIDTTKYDITTLVPIKGSAPFTTRITNTNQVEFIFQNINLPFATGSNQGYVAFKIKTKPTLVLGDTFSNTANIYFDYNAPIITNTATTTIAALVNPELVFTDYFTLSPIPTKGVVNINTKQDITISSISIYNTLGQVVLVTSNPSNTIDVSNLTTGSYFVKVITDKGSSSGKFIKE